MTSKQHVCVCVRGSTTRQQHILRQSLRLQIHHVHAHSIVWLSCEQRFIVRMCGIPGVETRKHTPFSPQRTGCLGDVATTERDELDCRFRQEFASVSAITLPMFILLIITTLKCRQLVLRRRHTQTTIHCERRASQRQQRLRHRMSCGTSQDTRRLKNHSTDDGFDDDVIMT